MTDARLILLSPEDNCLAVGASLAAGSELEVEGERVRAPLAIGGGLQARQDVRIRRLLLGVRVQGVEMHAGAIDLAAVEQDRDHVEARGGVGRVQRDGVAQVIRGDAWLTTGERLAGGAVLDLRGVRNQAVEKSAHECLGLRRFRFRDDGPVDMAGDVGKYTQLKIDASAQNISSSSKSFKVIRVGAGE